MNTSVEAKKFPRQKKGFTIIELLVVIAIIGVLAAISFVIYKGIKARADAAATMAMGTQIAKKLALHNEEEGHYPTKNAWDDGSWDDSSGDGWDDGSNGGWWDNIDYEPTCDDKACGEGELPDGYNLTIGKGISKKCIVNYDCTDDEWVALRKFSSEQSTGVSMNVSENCPKGFIPVPGNKAYGQDDFCVMKYEAKKVDGEPKSVAAYSPWANITQNQAIEESEKACSDCHLITESEWMTIASNVANVGSNWTGGTVGSGKIYNGLSQEWYGLFKVSGGGSSSNDDSDGYYGLPAERDNTERRIYKLSNGKTIWDLSGNYAEFTSGQVGEGKPGCNFSVCEYWMIDNFGDMDVDIFPDSMGILQVDNDNATELGFGMLLSSYKDTEYKAAIRGHDPNLLSGRGLLYANYSIDIDEAPKYSDNVSRTGFRVAK